MANSYTELVLQARESLENRVRMLHEADQQILCSFGPPGRHTQLVQVMHKLRDRMIPEAETFLDYCLVQWAKEEWGPTKRPATELGVPNCG